MTPLDGSILPMSQTLPESVRAALVRASRIESREERDGECAPRNAAVEAVIRQAKIDHPQFFQ